MSLAEKIIFPKLTDPLIISLVKRNPVLGTFSMIAFFDGVLKSPSADPALAMQLTDLPTANLAPPPLNLLSNDAHCQ